MKRDEDIQAIREKITAAITEQMNTMDPREMTSAIIADIQKQKAAVVWKVLGMEDRFGGRWEVDHCNGRTSPMTEHIASQCSAEITAYMVEATKEVLEARRGVLKPKIKAALEQEIDRQTRNAMDRNIREVAASYVNEIIAEVKSEIARG